VASHTEPKDDTRHISMSTMTIAYEYWKTGLLPESVMHALIDRMIEQDTGIDAAKMRQTVKKS
jgi:hypothetical protein